MRWTQNFIFTLKEAPSDAEIASHTLLVRGGYIKKIAPGIHTLQNLAVRTLRKIEGIIREELDKRGCTEIIMPIVQPKELWEETGRWKEMGDGLLKFKNRNGHEFCLGATHEEVVTDIVRKDVRSYRDLPKNLYQIQTKYRDEIRPRFGLMRGREFVMKDAYSFDKNPEDALKTYAQMYEAYESIFSRMGLNFRIVQADAGNIGGSQTHEFQVLAQSGEDHLMVCDSCRYAANIEVAPALEVNPQQNAAQEARLAKEKFSTPKQRTIADLAKFTGVPAHNLVKTLFYADEKNKPFAVLLRGSDEVNPVKLKNHLGFANPPLFLTDDEVQKLTGARPGSCGPVGLTIPIYADTGTQGMINFIVGANEDDFHLKNVNFSRDFSVTAFADLRLAREGDLCPECKVGHYKSLRGIEVGHVFYLGKKYSQAMNATYLNPEGKAIAIEMGCYGIGVTRTMQAAVEQNHDADGIIWPAPIAPFHVHICLLDIKSERLNAELQSLTQRLDHLGVTYLIDDRDERPGIKFKDADLLGLPLRLNLGERSLEAGNFEMVDRRTKEKQNVPVGDVPERVFEWLKKNRAVGNHI